MARMAEGSVLLSVTAEVLFHDGANWIRMDNNINSHSGLSSIKLIKSTNEAIYRIIAIRNMDNKRIVDQVIFHRLKYKEATPSFHQWRNEHKQVIGLSFANTQEARHFYSGVRQALDSVVNFQQQFVTVPTTNQDIMEDKRTNILSILVDTSTYQDPQNFHTYNFQQQDIYSNGANQVEEVNNCYSDSNGRKITSTPTNGCYENNNNQRVYGNKYINNQGQVVTNQQQNNLIRRASQGSNISSSTGGSLPGPYGQQNIIVLVIPSQNTAYSTNNNNNLNEINSNNNNLYSSSIVEQQQQSNQSQSNLPPPPNNIYQQNTNNSQNVAPPPPPPPPPPELKNLLSAKQKSFAEQLRLVQLNKSNVKGNDNIAIKPSLPSTNNSLKENGSSSKVQSGGKQDLISELADRLNKRKMNCSTDLGNEINSNNRTIDGISGGTKNCKSQQICGSVQIKNCSNISQKISSGSSIASQDELVIVSNNNESGSKIVTTEDLSRFKSEMMEAFSAELEKFRTEITQQLCSEIAKLFNNRQ
ncbi:WH1 domain-containing protein [Meloidogyne graminicola]|uniref:WH1 domain-containing protein n=1 Tax=Meloidogyne graminicola TaxID=189291 RepID=A0A8S9ZSC9_9BILA|nr:WH1 domain-containing protein [Meloidogyne graminicola]